MTYPAITSTRKRNFAAVTLWRWRAERNEYRALKDKCDNTSVIEQMDRAYFVRCIGQRNDWQYGFRLALRYIGDD